MRLFAVHVCVPHCAVISESNPELRHLSRSRLCAGFAGRNWNVISSLNSAALLPRSRLRARVFEDLFRA